MHDPDILILDEPTTGLDPNQIVEIRELIRKLGREKTVIFSTHILSEVSATCDRVVIINGGKIVAEGTPAELLKRSDRTETVYALVRGPRDQVLVALRGMENVMTAEEKDRESADAVGYEIIPKAGVDLREYLFMTVKERGWSLLELRRTAASLEDVFRQLTK
jgi:ABC-2 type transport system ATP-binding protein